MAVDKTRIKGHPLPVDQKEEEKWVAVLTDGSDQYFFITHMGRAEDLHYAVLHKSKEDALRFVQNKIPYGFRIEDVVQIKDITSKAFCYDVTHERICYLTEVLLPSGYDGCLYYYATESAARAAFIEKTKKQIENTNTVLNQLYGIICQLEPSSVAIINSLEAENGDRQ